LKHSQITILTLVLLLFVAAVFLKLLNLIDLDSTELFSYGFILYGVATVYTSFGENNKFILFFGSAVFLSGILLSLPAHFEFVKPLNLFLPSSILIIGISLLIVYFDNTQNKSILVTSVVLLASGFVLIFLSRNIQFSIYLEAIVDIINVYWPALLIVSGVTIILKR
jgi:hypothetical protein